MLGQSFDAILRAAQAGSAWAFERLWAELGPLVAGYLRLQGATSADDLASETFIGVFQGIRAFEGDERSFRSWVLVIAHRRLLDDRRRATRRPVVVDQDGGPVPEVVGGHTEDEAMTELGTDAVRALLATLSDDQRAVLVLRILADLTIDQVAAVTGKRPGAVKALQRRGLARLRQVVSAEGVPL